MLFNRDLSWLAFNHRVLQEAKDATVHLYERLRFFSVFSSNPDEFFRVRYPVVGAFAKLNGKTIKKESFLTEEDVSEKILATRILNNGEQQQIHASSVLHNAQIEIYDYLKKISC